MEDKPATQSAATPIENRIASLSISPTQSYKNQNRFFPQSVTASETKKEGVKNKATTMSQINSEALNAARKISYAQIAQGGGSQQCKK